MWEIHALFIVTMPFLKSPKSAESWKCSDELAQKKGILHTVYSINGDEYTGEWLNNKKHGIHIYMLYNNIILRTNVLMLRYNADCALQ